MRRSSLFSGRNQRHMAIKLRLRRSAIPRKADREPTVEEFTIRTFNDWRRGVEHREGSMSETILPAYFKAVQLGFHGHMGQWVDAVLAAGGMSADDFPPADPHDRRPNL